MVIFALLIFGFNKLMFRYKFNPLIFLWGTFVLLGLMLAITFGVNLILKVAVIPMFVLTGMQLVYVLKMISFSHILYDVRRIIESMENGTFDLLFNEKDVDKNTLAIVNKHKDKFEDYVSLSSFFYYVFLPTYCYQLEFPKIDNIRGLWTLKNMGMAALSSVVLLFILLEFTYPHIIELTEIITSDDKTFSKLYPQVS